MASSARAARIFFPSAVIGGSFPFLGSTMSDVRRLLRERGLAAIQSELREVVVHVGDGAGFGLRRLTRRGRFL